MNPKEAIVPLTVEAQPDLRILTLLAENVAHWTGQFELHAERARMGMISAVQARLLAGGAALGLKKKCAHGQFEQLRAAHFPGVNERTMRNWQDRAEADLRNPALRGAAEAVLLKREDAEAWAAFDQASRDYYAKKATLLKDAAEEIHLLPAPAPRGTSGPRPARTLTPDEEIQKRREAAAQSWSACELQLTGAGSSFVLLDDFAVEAQMGFLERQLKARQHWLKTPKAKRNRHAVEAIEDELNPPPVKAAKRKEKTAKRG